MSWKEVEDKHGADKFKLWRDSGLMESIPDRITGAKTPDTVREWKVPKLSLRNRHIEKDSKTDAWTNNEVEEMPTMFELAAPSTGEAPPPSTGEAPGSSDDHLSISQLVVGPAGLTSVPSRARQSVTSRAGQS